MFVNQLLRLTKSGEKWRSQRQAINVGFNICIVFRIFAKRIQEHNYIEDLPGASLDSTWHIEPHYNVHKRMGCSHVSMVSAAHREPTGSFCPNMQSLKYEYSISRCSFADQHCYEYIPGPVTWGVAFGQAAEKYYTIGQSNISGHLVTITSAAEFSFVRDSVLGSVTSDVWTAGEKPCLFFGGTPSLLTCLLTPWSHSKFCCLYDQN